MRLFRAEWSRLFARRFTKIMIVVILAIMGLIGLGVLLSSHRPTPSVVAQAHTRAEEVRAQVRQQRADCEQEQRNPSQGQTDKQFPPGFDCSEVSDSFVRDEDFMPHTFSFRAEAPTLFKVLGGLLALFGFAIGASFVGAEWSSGGMANLLLWRPRRIPVLLTKLLALLAGVTTVSVLFAGVWAGALYTISQTRGRLGPITAGSLQSLGLDGLRGLALGLVAAVAGFALASLGRHTAVAMGIAIGWILVTEVGLRIVLQIAEVTKPERWVLSTYVTAWLNKGLHLTDYTPCRFAQGSCEPIQWSVSSSQSAMLLGGLALAGLTVAVVEMRRRDVT
jgi:hypothetical protein